MSRAAYLLTFTKALTPITVSCALMPAERLLVPIATIIVCRPSGRRGGKDRGGQGVIAATFQQQ